MAATDPLVLPRDLLIIPVTDLSDEVRRQFDCADSDYAVTRPNARSRSQIIDTAGAQLLEEFRTPKTIVQAILAFSQARQVDPAETLERSFPFLCDLSRSRFLVPADSPEADRIEPVFAAGETVADCEVLRCVQVLDDTEVYQVRDPAGRLGALKCVRPGLRGRLTAVFQREAAVLRHLAGPVSAVARLSESGVTVGRPDSESRATASPALLAEGTHEGRPYLLLEWVAGVNVAVAAEELRRLDTAAGPKLLALGCALAEAYAWLHAQQVVHGDVHPRNVLVDDQGRVKLIDLGQAQLDPAPADWLAPQRAGIGFFFEPEYAQALRQQQPPPAASPQGEQYALGALLYFLFTGAHYLDFSVEPDKMFRQITDDPPLPFARRGLAPWPEVEGVLARALHKDPAQRFASVADLARALRDAEASAQARPLRGPGPSRNSAVNSPPGAALLATTLHNLGTSGPLLARGVPAPPTASVNYGAAGIAYLFYRIACLRGDPRLLATADLWANRARQESARADAFYNPAIEITEETVGRIALYHTASGMHCVQALISQALGDGFSAHTAVQGFIAAARQPCTNLDLTLGQSSILIGCAALREALADSAGSDATELAELGQEILQRIWSQLDAYGPLNECSELAWLGIAHGWAGILYATLRWCQAAGSALPANFLARLEQLAGCAEPAGRGLCWPRLSRRGVGNREPWSGWCHGSAGYVFLWTLAYQATGAAEWLRLAQGAAWHTWEDSGANGHSLCCGLAGRAYALLSLYKCVGDALWLERAREPGQRAVASAAGAEPMPHSLYKGGLGVALLAADLEQPAAACMPLFEAEGWPPAQGRSP